MSTEMRELKNSLERLFEDLLLWEKESAHEIAYSLLASAEDVYHPEALKIWEKRLQSSPADFVALHHLAIMHHARAYDLESQMSAEAFSEWEKALILWSGLHRCGEFWEEREARGKGLGDRFDPRELEELRKELPLYLLEVHADLVREYYRSADSSRSGRHMGIILQARFPEEIKEGLHYSLYKELTAGVEADVNARNFEAAVIKTEKYLSIDPEYRKALRDVVDLFNKWNDGYFAAKDYRSIEKIVRRAARYVERLEKIGAGEMGVLVSEVLSEHYWSEGLMYDDRPKKFNEMLEENRDPGLLECSQAVSDYQLAVKAYKKSFDYDNGLRTQQRTNRLRNCYVELAHAQMLKGGKQSGQEREGCLESCWGALREGEILAKQAGDEKLLGIIKNIRAGVDQNEQTIFINSLLDQSVKLVNAGQWRSALEKLEKIVQYDRDSGFAHLLMGYCFAGLGRMHDANRAFQKAGEIALKAGDMDLLKAVAQAAGLDKF